jgi:uronate dehydrogenase
MQLGASWALLHRPSEISLSQRIPQVKSQCSGSVVASSRDGCAATVSPEGSDSRGGYLDETSVAITGAAGRIGTVLRAGLNSDVETMRCLDIRPIPALLGHEVAHQLDLADLDGMVAAFEGCEGVIHLGGYPTEADFHDLADVNIVCTYHVLEAARRAGVRRVAYASSNRVTGFYPVRTKVSPDIPVGPDSLYGVSKVAGETLCQLYVDKFGLSAVGVRIGTLIDEPGNTRRLST